MKKIVLVASLLASLATWSIPANAKHCITQCSGNYCNTYCY